MKSLNFALIVSTLAACGGGGGGTHAPKCELSPDGSSVADGMYSFSATPDGNDCGLGDVRTVWVVSGGSPSDYLYKCNGDLKAKSSCEVTLNQVCESKRTDGTSFNFGYEGTLTFDGDVYTGKVALTSTSADGTPCEAQVQVELAPQS